MSESHPILELALFADGRADSQERQRVVRHLLQGCSSCSEALRRQLSPAADLDALSAVVDRVLERSRSLLQQVDRERERVFERVEHLGKMPPSEQEAWIDGLEGSELRVACDALVASCHRARHEDAGFHLRLAELTVRAAERLSDADRGEMVVRAWGELGNARRIPGDLLGAQQALTHAEATLEDLPVVEPAVEAELLLRRAVLARDLRRTDESLRLYDEAREIYRQLQDLESEVSALIGMGITESEPRDGILHLKEALSRLEADQPDLLRITLHNLAFLSLDAGDLRAAESYADQARPLVNEESAPRLDRIRFEWLVGRLLCERGRLDEAAATLEEVRQRYIEEDLPFEVALSALDLAAVYAQSGGRRPLKELVAETVDIFKALGIAQDSIVALHLLAQAETLEVLEVVGQLTRILESQHPRPGVISMADR